ncbi:hypothetical protein BDI4_1120027 [Burkholderia diffusa]|nr:hypothetical protein BDI4_1120027 [Burkholderia diffusa]
MYAEAFSLFVHKLGIKLVAASGDVRVAAQATTSRSSRRRYLN